MKALTIVVPVYNTEKYLARCLDSILFKDVLDNIEVICVNDGSSDSSLSILRNYEKRYPKSVVVIDKENGGHGSTINAALKIARGKYFKVLDSDDWFNPIDFEILVNKLGKLDADLVITNYRQDNITTGESTFFSWRDLTPNKLYKFDEIDLNSLQGDYFIMQESFWLTKILKDSNLKLLEKTFYVDMQFNTIPIEKFQTFVFLDLDIYRYFIGRKDQSVDLRSFVKNKKQHEEVMLSLLNNYVRERPKLSTNKEAYFRMIIKYMLCTHYYIFCVYDPDKKNARKEIYKFDKELLKISPIIWDEMGAYAMIHFYRRFRFYSIYISYTFLSFFNLLYFNIFRKNLI
jgi:glycosyltransferase involved in cell wall biosynthesis